MIQIYIYIYQTRINTVLPRKIQLQIKIIQQHNFYNIFIS